MSLATVPEAVCDFKAGKFVIVVDDEDRENEGDLVVAAQLVTPDHISFMTHHGSGLVCLPVVAKRLDELGIAPMVERNTSRLGTAFSVSIDARDTTTTGASAHDRAATIRKVVDPDARPSDFSMPGHTFPLRAAEGGVLTRAGQTEAAVDLVKIWRYIKKQSSPEMADRVESVIRDKIRFLAENPGAGHWRKNLTDQAVKFFPVYSYLIVYRPDTRPLQVVSILHGRRDVEKILSVRL